MTNKNNLYWFLWGLIIAIVSVQPAHAYAGPGSAIGIILVIITVLFAFFSSVFIKIINLIKTLFLLLKKKFSKKKYREKKNKKR